MKYDGKIDIATGMSARSKVWKNESWPWSKLVKVLTTENKTNETFKQFISSSKEDQGKIKDVGGYVGGYLQKGKRSPQNVLHRQLMTLDIDFAHLEFWGDFTMMFSNAAVLHATHKHSDESPRFRLIMPLARECTADEYVAVSRKIAGMLGIELFDNTTFETNRLMFWPSNPKDIKYYYEVQDGEWLDPDAILQTYKDWTDSTQWPTAQKYIDDTKTAATKQQDPTQKKGVIGMFCRTYGVHEAIETFLSDIYEPCLDDRYTYLKGSTSAGLAVYDNLFAYSHHGTDPCGNKLCNAFDLVRIHKFGHLDTSAGMDSVNSKSYKAMERLILKDDNVRKEIASEKLNEAKYDFAEQVEVDTEWAKELEIDGRGRYLSTALNLNIIFANDPYLKGAFRQNNFDMKRYLFKSVPWRAITEPEPMKNVDYSGVRNYIETVYGITGNLKIDDGLALEFERYSFHPIKDYLDSLSWDGVQRLDTIMIDYFGVQDNIYTREAIRKSLVAAVARIFAPGIKYDLVLTIVGSQGTGKSTFINKLGKGFSSDSFVTVQGKEAFEQLQGAWLIEMAELAGLRKAEIESVKHFISKQEDTFRPAYARTPETFKRQCVFFGTTNNKDFLRDPSGNRRFLPINVNIAAATKDIFGQEFEDDIDHFWAEAVHLFKKKEPLYLSPDAEAIAYSEQAKHSASDDRKGLVENYLNLLLPKHWEDLDLFERRMFLENAESQGTEPRDVVCVAEVWCECFNKNKEDMSRYNTRDINDIMRSLEDWEETNSTKNFNLYGKQKYYAKKLY